MLKAYGLVYQLTLGDPHPLGDQPDRAAGGSDFTASATDLKTNAVITSTPTGAGLPRRLGGRGAALPIVTAWQARTRPPCTRPQRSAPTSRASSSRRDRRLPDATRTSLRLFNAAGIPDSLGQPWPLNKANSYPGHPDILATRRSPARRRRTTPTGRCSPRARPRTATSRPLQRGRAQPEVVAETRHWLTLGPVHFFAECQAVSAFENDRRPGTCSPNGFVNAEQPASVTIVVPRPVRAARRRLQDGRRQRARLQRQRRRDALRGRLAPRAGHGRAAGHVDGFPHRLPRRDPHQGQGELPRRAPVQHQDADVGQRRHPGHAPLLELALRLRVRELDRSPLGLRDQAGPGDDDQRDGHVHGELRTPAPAWRSAPSSPIRPAGAAFVSATGGGMFAAGTVTWNLGDLSSGAAGMVTVTVNLTTGGSCRTTGCSRTRSATAPRR